MRTLRFLDPRRLFTGARRKQFVLGVSAGLTAQAIVAFVRWLRAPALRG